MIGQLIGKYKITEHIGEGGMASVYLAVRPPLNTEYALKVLKNEFFLNTDIKNRFIHEAHKLAKLKHPNIVRVHDLIENNKQVAIVLDKISGRTVSEKLKNEGKFDPDKDRAIFEQMFGVINYLHSEGYIHRDLKPSNFMITDDKKVYLIDFGISKSLNSEGIDLDFPETNSFVYMGTPLYMSPEQFKSSKHVVYNSDVFSLGVVIWEMLTAAIPFGIEKGDSLFEIYDKINKNELSKTNPFWDEIIQSATLKDPALRKINLPNFNPLPKKLRITKGEWLNQKTKQNFKTITIDDQTWTAENLSINHFSNGNKILEARNLQEWKNAVIQEKSAWCYYDFDEANKDYGKLYNYFAVHPAKETTNSLAPQGWRIPTIDDWKCLKSKLEKNNNLEIDFFNCTEAKVLYTGEFYDFTFIGLNQRSVWWSSNISEKTEYVINQIYSKFEGFKETFKKGKQMGYSVILIKI